MCRPNKQLSRVTGGRRLPCTCLWLPLLVLIHLRSSFGVMLACANLVAFFRLAPCGSSDLNGTQRLRAMSSPSTRSKLSGDRCVSETRQTIKTHFSCHFMVPFAGCPEACRRAAVTAHPRVFRLFERSSLMGPVCGWQLHLPSPCFTPGCRIGRGHPAYMSRPLERYIKCIYQTKITSRHNPHFWTNINKLPK